MEEINSLHLYLYLYIVWCVDESVCKYMWGANDVKWCVCEGERRKERFSGLISVIKSSVRAVKAGRT